MTDVTIQQKPAFRVTDNLTTMLDGVSRTGSLQKEEGATAANKFLVAGTNILNSNILLKKEVKNIPYFFVYLVLGGRGRLP